MFSFLFEYILIVRSASMELNIIISNLLYFQLYYDFLTITDLNQLNTRMI